MTPDQKNPTASESGRIPHQGSLDPVPYWYTITKWGHVYLRRLPTDFAQSYAAPGALRPGTLAAKLFKPPLRTPVLAP